MTGMPFTQKQLLIAANLLFAIVHVWTAWYISSKQ